jgi:hypothetical protein
MLPKVKQCASVATSAFTWPLTASAYLAPKERSAPATVKARKGT